MANQLKANGIHILNEEGYVKVNALGILEVTFVQYDDNDEPQDEFVYGTVAISADAGSSKQEFLEIFLRELNERLKDMNRLKNKNKRG